MLTFQTSKVDHLNICSYASRSMSFFSSSDTARLRYLSKFCTILCLCFFNFLKFCYCFWLYTTNSVALVYTVFSPNWGW